MTMFTLTVFPDGKLLLTTEEELSERAVAQIKDQFAAWRATDEGVAIISECRTEHAQSVEIDLGPESAPDEVPRQ